MSKAGPSALLVEANALSEGLANAEWTDTRLGLAKNRRYRVIRRDNLNREFKLNAIVSKKEDHFDIVTITDAKSLYTNLTREQYSATEKRAALEICEILDSLEALNGSVRWVPREWNPVDSMTKMHGNERGCYSSCEHRRIDSWSRRKS